jgi:hypothetical protein
MRRWLLALCLLLSLVFATPPAHAQKQKKERIRALFQAGAQAYKQGKFLAAVQAFEEAYKLDPKPPLLFSGAQALRRQFAVDGDVKHLQKALANYRKYLDQVKEGGRRLDAAKAIEELRPVLARASGAGAGAGDGAGRVTRLMITTQADEATVIIDGQKPLAMPFIEEVKPGKHVIRVQADGYRPAQRNVVAIEGAVVAVEIPLVARPALLEVAGADGAELLVDGKERGGLPLSAPLELTPGRHVVTVLERGHEPFTRDVDVDRGASVTVDAELKGTRLRTASYLVMGTGAVGLIAAAVLAGLAYDAERDATAIAAARASGAQRTEQDRVAFNDSLDRRDELRLAGGVAAAMGGVLLAVGVTLWLLDTPTAPPFVAPGPGDDGDDGGGTPDTEDALEVYGDVSISDEYLGGSLIVRF